MDAAVEAVGIRKAYRGHVAVEGLTLTVPRGVTYGILGPNGAGKTTALRMILGVLLPDAGWVRVLGEKPTGSILDRVGYLPEERGLYARMRVRDCLVFFGEIKGMARRAARAAADRWLERLELAPWAEHRVAELSKGMQQKAQLAATLLHDPELLILDEPFSGLDPLNVEALKEVLRELRAEGRTILLSTHMTEQAEDLLDFLGLIHRARLVLDGDLAGIRRSRGEGRYRIRFAGEAGFLSDGAVESWTEDGGVADGDPAHPRRDVVVKLRPSASASAFLRAASAAAEVEAFGPLVPTIRQVFIETVGASIEEEERAEAAP